MWLQCRVSLLFGVVAGWERSMANHGRLASFEDISLPFHKNLRAPPLWNLRMQKRNGKEETTTTAAPTTTTVTTTAAPTTTTTAPTTTMTTTTFNGVHIKVVIKGAPADDEAAAMENSPSAAAQSIKTAWSSPTGKLAETLTENGWDGSQLPAAVIAGSASGAITGPTTITTTTPPPPTTSQSTTTPETTTVAQTDGETTPAPITTKVPPTTDTETTAAASEPVAAEPPEIGTMAPPETETQYEEVDGETVACANGACASAEGGFVPAPTS
eukprot:gnl/MRDRNA2_/MRDRNA2_106182_c0_seq1.p1 gnl/MRDRNA2_/MRDRNA2_106182_c0~~gnl/MRDRNA2_/MRDRNA2_106182_c0_seq1.p1  ORF type:complete len:271 (-),score=50.15 gnl/MRDRNA2_/MRDRNA2_106182_c0_seq1:24-836(-)